MSERNKGEVIFSSDESKDKEKETTDISPLIIIEHVVKKYFSSESGQERLMNVLNTNIENPDERDDIFDFINAAEDAEAEEDLGIQAAQALEDKYGLIEMLGSAIKPPKSKEQLVKEVNDALDEAQMLLESIGDKIKGKKLPN